MYINLVAFCKDKEPAAHVFHVLKKKDVDERMRSFYSELSPFLMSSFHVNYIVSKILEEPVTDVKEEEMLKYLDWVILYARNVVGIKENEEVIVLKRLSVKQALLEEQLAELKEMKKKVKRGESIVLLTKEEKDLLKMKPIDRKKDKKEMEKEYERIMKIATDEEKRGIPISQRRYLKKTKEEWEQEWKRDLSARVKERDEKREKVKHLFEKQPTVREVKERIRVYESKLENVSAKMESSENCIIDSTSHVLKKSIDPRIIVSWCKRVAVLVWHDA